METQYINDNCDVVSESSLSWSGGEGHEGDDELTDWAPSQDTISNMDQPPWHETDPREIRAGYLMLLCLLRAKVMFDDANITGQIRFKFLKLLVLCIHF